MLHLYYTALFAVIIERDYHPLGNCYRDQQSEARQLAQATRGKRARRALGVTRLDAETG